MLCVDGFSSLLGTDLLGVELPDNKLPEAELLHETPFSRPDESQVGGEFEALWAEGLSALPDAALMDVEELQKSPSPSPGESRAGEEAEPV